MKKLISVFLTIILIISTNFTIAAAKEKDTDLSSLYTIKKVPITEIPENSPTFASEKDAIAYLNKIAKSVSENNKDKINKTNDTSAVVTPLSTNDIVLVDTYDGVSCDVRLYANYGTSGDANTGHITYISPFTTFTGVTLGWSWVQSNSGYNIQTNGKDAYIFTNGMLIFTFVVKGVGNIATLQVNLGRMCYLAR